MSEYLQANCDYWSQAVYDTPNTESYVFRIYGRIIKHEFNFDGSKKEKLLVRDLMFMELIKAKLI